jgi:hypothetical protein
MKTAFAFALAVILLAMAYKAFAAPLPKDRALQRCMVYLPEMKDSKLRQWCLQQGKRMP